MYGIPWIKQPNQKLSKPYSKRFKGAVYSQFQYVSPVLAIPYEVLQALENILFQCVWKSRKKGKSKEVY